ncbi:MAG: PspC domain-containing protein, partial [Bacillota bacterium]
MNKKLYRSTEDKMLGGVCAGIAEYFEIDPTLIRLIFVLIFFAEGIGFLAYIVAWIIIPERPDSNEKNKSNNNKSSTERLETTENGEIENHSQNTIHRKSNSQNIWGIILII